MSSVSASHREAGGEGDVETGRRHHADQRQHPDRHREARLLVRRDDPSQCGDRGAPSPSPALRRLASAVRTAASERSPARPGNAVLAAGSRATGRDRRVPASRGRGPARAPAPPAGRRSGCRPRRPPAEQQHQRLARPGARPAPGRVEREIVDHARPHPGRGVRPGQGDAGGDRPVAAGEEFVVEAGAQGLRIVGREGVLEFGGELEEQREAAHQRVRMGAGCAGWRRP